MYRLLLMVRHMSVTHVWLGEMCREHSILCHDNQITRFRYTSSSWQPWQLTDTPILTPASQSWFSFQASIMILGIKPDFLLKHFFSVCPLFFLFVCFCPLLLSPPPLDGMLCCGASSDLQPSLDRVRSASANCLTPDNHVPSPETERYQPLSQPTLL